MDTKKVNRSHFIDDWKPLSLPIMVGKAILKPDNGSEYGRNYCLDTCGSDEGDFLTNYHGTWIFLGE